MEEILKKVLERVTPTAAEHEQENAIVEKIIGKLSAKDVKPILVGSLAKNTDLRGDKDIDIFIMFDESVERKELE
ncbi:MAG: nucleotidyltransferase domain-containing protein, partial [Candidatus Altiarchaeota archaeon]|nr:nucleotidyltransferase domain-containing protein [Candidatus Altiarchaeota archaeon]